MISDAGRPKDSEESLSGIFLLYLHCFWRFQPWQQAFVTVISGGITRAGLIDRVTDRLVGLDLARKRRDGSMFESISANATKPHPGTT